MYSMYVSSQMWTHLFKLNPYFEDRNVQHKGLIYCYTTKGVDALPANQHGRQFIYIHARESLLTCLYKVNLYHMSEVTFIE